MWRHRYSLAEENSQIDFLFVTGIGNQRSSGLASQFLAKNILVVLQHADPIVRQKRKKRMVWMFQGKVLIKSRAGCRITGLALTIDGSCIGIARLFLIVLTRCFRSWSPFGRNQENCLLSRAREIV